MWVKSRTLFNSCRISVHKVFVYMTTFQIIYFFFSSYASLISCFCFWLSFDILFWQSHYHCTRWWFCLFVWLCNKFNTKWWITTYSLMFLHISTKYHIFYPNSCLLLRLCPCSFVPLLNRILFVWFETNYDFHFNVA